MSVINLSGHVYTMEENVDVQRTRRRRHSAEFKAEAVSACMQPGISIAAVALHYRLNANLLRRWVAEQEALDVADQARRAMTVLPPEFVPLQLPTPVSAPARMSSGAVASQMASMRITATSPAARWRNAPPPNPASAPSRVRRHDALRSRCLE